MLDHSQRLTDLYQLSMLEAHAGAGAYQPGHTQSGSPNESLVRTP
jgi:hypothetical protein